MKKNKNMNNLKNLKKKKKKNQKENTARLTGSVGLKVRVERSQDGVYNVSHST